MGRLQERFVMRYCAALAEQGSTVMYPVYSFVQRGDTRVDPALVARYVRPWSRLVHLERILDGSNVRAVRDATIPDAIELLADLEDLERAVVLEDGGDPAGLGERPSFAPMLDEARDRLAFVPACPRFQSAGREDTLAGGAALFEGLAQTAERMIYPEHWDLLMRGVSRNQYLGLGDQCRGWRWRCGIARSSAGGQTTAMGWLPADFVHPARVAVGAGHHLRPITAADVDLDYPAVMGSRLRLWAIFGAAWGWPPASLTYEQDREDLARHEAEIAAHLSFNYALFDEAETSLLGCVYIDPPEKQGADAEICWWVADGPAGTGLEQALDALVPGWIAAAWPFTHPRYIGRDLSWADWLALPGTG